LARVAVLGGSFNPIHHGHLLLADEILEMLGVDRVLFVPAAVPPHKAPADLAPAADRFAMVQLAIAGHAGFAVSDLELRRPGPSYADGAGGGG
jgi:nicotinate-nucleotide adenylyltransferase